MSRKTLSILLVIIMVACFAGALYYPLMYKHQQKSNESDMDALREMRRAAQEDSAEPAQTYEADVNNQADETASPDSGSAEGRAAIGDSEDIEPVETEPDVSANEEAEPVQLATEQPMLEQAMAEPTPEPVDDMADRRVRTWEVLPYPEKERVELDEQLILPQYKEIYQENNDLVGWLYIPNTEIDYPVLQSEDNDYYLYRDFYGNDNKNGQLILDSKCDPWTPSYNLVISGHNMKHGLMFGTLPFYETKGYWKNNKIITFDTLMREGQYVIFAVFYSADYDENEEGFRYNADIRYELDAEVWLAEIEENKLYDTGIDVQFGDEFLTLTTCTYQRENGRFVVVARRVREGEVIK